MRQESVQKMLPADPDGIRAAVRRTYGGIASGETAGCCAPGVSCCGPRPAEGTAADRLGYSKEEILAVPTGADLGLGCGNPQAIASLKPGESVLDLGSGAGFDCFLAARSVGPAGHVLGVDMTAEMIAKARAHAARLGIANVEFRLGEIESLPVADDCVDVILSNCVINLSPEKARVFREAFRVLRPGGRLAVADIMRTAELPPEVAADLVAYGACVAGAASVEEVENLLREAGFTDVRVRPKEASLSFIREWTPGRDAADYVVSATIEAVKPAGACCGPACCQ